MLDLFTASSGASHPHPQGLGAFTALPRAALESRLL